VQDAPSGTGTERGVIYRGLNAADFCMSDVKLSLTQSEIDFNLNGSWNLARRTGMSDRQLNSHLGPITIAIYHLNFPAIGRHHRLANR
jgi:hypothetical protein